MKPTPEFADCWVCEGCGRVSEGVNPPDECSVCEHKFHESMADMIAVRAKTHPYGLH